MYAIIIFALSALGVVAVAEAFLGVLRFNPLSMMGGGVVLVVTAFIVNSLVGYVAGIRPHHQSALITALILFFMVSPPRDLREYVGLALLSGFAMATKYIIAFRGRHIANPAASAAVIAGLVGITTATWWVATGPLLIPTIVFGAAVIYKTKRQAMALTYVASAFTVTMLLAVIGGRSVIELAPTIITSYPILFLAAFMLTEPLTTPPRRHQRYIVAAFIGVIGSLPFGIGRVIMTPELSLVIGNIVAFLFTQRGKVQLQLKAKNQLAPSQFEYVFSPSRPARYHAGQYLELTLPHKKPDLRGYRRMFTIAAAPSSNEIRIATRINSTMSSFKRTLHSLEPGDIVQATGIYGDFILPKNKNAKILMLAGGIGVTPFRAHIESLILQKGMHDVTLLYFARGKGDALYTDLFRKAKKSGISVHIVSNRISVDTLRQYVTDSAERIAYISGPPAFVDASKQVLRTQGIRKIITDYFTGY